MVAKSIHLALFSVLLYHAASAQWVRTSLDSCTVTCFAISGTNLFAGTRSGVFLSMDGGANWTAVNSGLGCWGYVWDLAVGETNLFAATAGISPRSCGGVYLSTNNGTNWTLVNDSIRTGALAVSGKNLFAGFGGVMLSTDNGTSWTAVNNGLTGAHVNALCVDGTNLFAGTYGGVFRSTNNGTSWTKVDSGLTEETDVWCLAVSNTNILAGTNRGAFLSTNNGTSWTAVNSGLTDPFVSSLAASGTNLFAGTHGGGVFQSTNNGTSWTAVNAGLTSRNVWSLVICGTMLLAGTEGGGIWRRPLSEMITSVDSRTNQLPHEFSLKQNYPNPFNPSTTIRYGLPSQSHVILTVFNLLGQQVATLVEGEMEAGYHEIKFDASNLASGVYLYRLSAGDFVQARKLTVLR